METAAVAQAPTERDHLAVATDEATAWCVRPQHWADFLKGCPAGDLHPGKRERKTWRRDSPPSIRALCRGHLPDGRACRSWRGSIQRDEGIHRGDRSTAMRSRPQPGSGNTPLSRIEARGSGAMVARVGTWTGEPVTATCHVPFSSPQIIVCEGIRGRSSASAFVSTVKVCFEVKKTVLTSSEPQSTRVGAVVEGRIPERATTSSRKRP